MARAPLNKTSLLAQRRAIAAYQVALPALELRRRSLAKAWAAEARTHAALEAEVRTGLDAAADDNPMAADMGLEIESLLRIERMEIAKTSVIGVALPSLEGVDFAQAEVGGFTHPHWAAAAVAQARRLAEADLRRQVCAVRMARLAKAAARAAQRVNLLERVLIPQAQARVREIEIRLADLQRAEVAGAKLAKARLQGAP